MKKGIKIAIFILLGIALLLGVGISYIYYQTKGKYDVDEEKYTHYIGYLNDSIEESKFQRCDKLIGWFSSATDAAPIFNGSKSNFKKLIQENFVPVNSIDNGFLNLRFIINCHGDVGSIEVKELDNNFQPSKFSSDLVTQLIELSSKKDNWVVPIFDNEATDSYMYLIYKIENGQIIEILP